jgi:tRNA pseudouridine38-40 synthase
MRIALGVAYEGTAYHGWQRQDNNLPTIQGHLEAALSKVADAPIHIFCAGRTDGGVHALGQTAHFDTTAVRSERAWVMGVNSLLPPAIRVHWAQVVDDNFHARFSALARSYRYIIYNQPTRSALLANKSTWHIKPLAEQQMQVAAQYLVGEHDFTSFRAAGCQAKTAMRTIHYLTIQRKKQLVIMDIKANAFLHHMVRNIVGVLLPIGAGIYPPEWAQTVLTAKNRVEAGITAPSAGLYFEKAYYPEAYQFPIDTELLFI